MVAKPKYYWIGVGKDDFLYETVTNLQSLDEILVSNIMTVKAMAVIP
jgi:hypothetical protein